MVKKILLISGSLPPIKCGVGYYTHRLINELNSVQLAIISTQGVKHDFSYPLYTVPDWKIRRLPKLLQLIKVLSPSVVHIQYPTVGYQRHLGINLLPLLLRLLNHKSSLIITLHEYHESRLLGKFRNFLTVFPADKIIVSNIADKKTLPNWISKKTKIIPIGSNLTKVPRNKKIYIDVIRRAKLNTKTRVLFYFGFAFPNKGLESLLEAMKEPYLSKWQLLLLTSLDRNDRYHKKLKATIEGVNKYGIRIGVTGFLSDKIVSAVLQEGEYFILPSPKPLTAKSGTAIAAIQHNLVLIAKRSESPEINEPFKHLHNCYLVNDLKSSTIAKSIKLLENSPSIKQVIIKETKSLMKYFSWRHITIQHLKLYEKK